MTNDKPENEKKRHHYVPITYLNEFSDSDGRIFAYRKDDPLPALHLKPDEIAFERYYYSQPLPDNRRDNNTIENFFSTIETPWPSIIARIRTHDTTREDLSCLFEFLSMMRVRVPAARDMAETNLAATVKAQTNAMDRAGLLQPKPPGIEDILKDIEVSIDPHMSIHAMPAMLKGFAHVIDCLGFGIVHNKTGHTFITSDNPVVYFDPDISESSAQPYRANPFRGRVELLFPIDPHTIFVGRTDWKLGFSASRIKHFELNDRQEVKRLNRFIAKFGYRFLFSSDNSHEPLAQKYAAISPVSRTTAVQGLDGEKLLFQCVFGERPKKPKWTRPKDQKFG
jgi:hypothetical protein